MHRIAKASVARACALFLALSFCVLPSVAEGASGPSLSKSGRHRSHAVKNHHHKPRRQRPAYWGAWIGDQFTGTEPPFDMSGTYALASVLGKQMSLLEFSSPFSNCSRSPCTFYDFPTRAMESIRAYGAIPVFSWGSQSTPWEAGAPNPDYKLSDVISGRYDTYIREFAEEARDWGHPFFLRFDWEMNGDWFPWAESINGNRKGQFVAAWRHVHDIFASVGATNATWVWCPFADKRKRFLRLRAYYPGDSYVDWTCLDGYNWGRNGVNSVRWKSFRDIFTTAYRKLVRRVAPRKPMMLGEFASSPNGGHKGLWIKNTFEALRANFPRIRALIWLDLFDRGINWPLETSPPAARAFARGIRGPAFMPNLYSELAPGPIAPPRRP